MSVKAGPGIVTDGLILSLNPTSIKNTKISSTSKIINGAFANGQGIPHESGSTITNTIVELPNPGDSPYVLRQNGHYTEYEIRRGAELKPSTNYVMSGWYARSLDYNGRDVMFHSRAYSASGAHTATGDGFFNPIYSVIVDGLLWRYGYYVISTPADYNNNFSWFLGFGQASPHTGYRYYTNIKLEEGTFPSLIDMSGKGNDHRVVGGVTYANNALTLNGTNGGFVRDFPLTGQTANCTVVIWYKTTDSQEIWVAGNNNTTHYLSASNGNNYYHAQVGTPTNYVDLKQVLNPVTEGYRNGQYHMWEAKNVNFTSWTSFQWFLYVSGWQLNGTVAGILVYDRPLTAEESAKNFAAFRSRVGI